MSFPLLVSGVETCHRMPTDGSCNLSARTADFSNRTSGLCIHQFLKRCVVRQVYS